MKAAPPPRWLDRHDGGRRRGASHHHAHTPAIRSVGIACRSDVRLPESGRRVILVPETSTACHLSHSGVTEGTIALPETVHPSLLECPHD